MAKGILGKNIGMTQVFKDDGTLLPVTVIHVGSNVVLQKKTIENDGYTAVQIGYGDKPERLANKPELGHVAKAEVTPKRFIKEILGTDMDSYSVGNAIAADIFSAGEIVDVTGISKGKGFQGVIKRYNFARGPMGHGSKYHRGIGSMGAVDSARIKKGKKMPGRMGGEQVTVQNLEVVKVDTEKGVILVKGNVPGPRNSYVIITNGVKVKKSVNAGSLV